MNIMIWAFVKKREKMVFTMGVDIEINADLHTFEFFMDVVLMPSKTFFLPTVFLDDEQNNS